MTDTELIPGLPYDVALQCLIRLHYSTHRVAARVNQTWNSLIKSKNYYDLRKRSGLTRKIACLLHSIPFHSALKPVSPARFGLIMFDFTTGSFDKIDPVPEYPIGLPLFCQVIGSESRVIVMGGWDPVSYEPVQGVFIYEFVTRSWKRGKDMPDSRSFFAAGEFNGKVYVAGGHDESKNALSSAWAYDLDSDKWTELAPMSQERDECEGIVLEASGVFCVVSGYRTESQGRFEESVEMFDNETGAWRRVEGAWKNGVCPRGRVGVKSDGGLFDWGEKVGGLGGCVVGLGDVSFVCGSEFQGGVNGVWVVEGATSGKMVEANRVDGFSGFVQAGCQCKI